MHRQCYKSAVKKKAVKKKHKKRHKKGINKRGIKNLCAVTRQLAAYRKFDSY